MKNKLSIAIGILITSLNALTAQPIGNEWIDFNKTYYKISLAETGIYELTYDDLADVGFPVNTIDPRRLQIYFRGTEQAIHVAGQNDASFDPDDYILFFGERNNGTLDSALYLAPDTQPHRYYNLFSDSSAYFLTFIIDGTDGKRMDFFKENNVFGLPAEEYHLERQLQLQTNSYSPGLHYPLGQTSAEIYRSEYDYGEGWSGSSIRRGNNQIFTFGNLTEVNRTGPDPEIEILLAGRNNLNHNATILVGPSQTNLRLIHTAEFAYHRNYKLNEIIQWSDISTAGELYVEVRVNGVGSSADFVSVSYVELEVPENFDHTGKPAKKYWLKPNTGNKSYIEIANVPAQTRIFDITNPNNVREIGFNRTGNDINAIISETLAGRELWLSSAYEKGFVISPVNFDNLNLSGKEYIIISHPALRIPTESYEDPVKAYAEFRATPEGGSFDTLLVNIQNLYNHYSYGEITPLAIQNFCRDLTDRANPQYLFLIGKGLTPNYNSHRLDFDTQTFKDLVPTYGFPGSDYIFSSQLNGSEYAPNIPTGRLTANAAGEVEAYLNKVKEMAAQPFDDLWRKNLVHLSGGRGSSEQGLFRFYVNNLAKIAEGPYLGGKVTTISKKTNNSTELINISDLINDGAGLVTFFGHSSSSGTDIEIGFVSDESQGYNNQGRYTTFLVNGCNSGDMYFTGRGWGEDWITTPNKGAVAFIAHTGTGISTTLRNYSDEFYLKGFGDTTLIKKGIGDIHKAAVQAYSDNYGDSPLDISQMQQMALNGDPAVKVFGAPLPDFAINEENIFVESVDGQPVNAFSETFNLGLILQNYGRTSDDTLSILVTRRLSNGETIELDTVSTTNLYYEDTIKIEVPSEGLASYGNNEFSISLDPLNSIEELNETNNSTSFTYFLPLGGTNNIYPRQLAIINDRTPQITVQSLDIFTGERNFQIELDTTDQFNSPVKQMTSITANVLARWEVELPSVDSAVFYLRSKYANPREGEIDDWIETSFTFIADVNDGWNMSGFDQFKWSNSVEIERDENTQSWQFKSFNTPIEIRTFGANHPEFGQNDVQLIIAGESYIFPGRLCTDNSINLVAFDRGTTAPYLNLRFNAIDVLDRRHCGETPTVINNFVNNEIENERCFGDKCIDRYISEVKNGDFVLMFSIGEVTYQNWSTSTIDSLELIGIEPTELLSLMNGDPIIALGTKGASPGAATIIKAAESPADQQELSFSDVLAGNVFSGTISSPVIGPARNWHSTTFNSVPTSSSGNETATFQIYGLNEAQNQTLIGEYGNGNVDLSGLDASQYPYLKLNFVTEDQEEFTPAQLKKWRVIYDGVPEGILYPADEIPEATMEYQEGEIPSYDFFFDNVSPWAYSDSVKIQYDIFNVGSRQNMRLSTKIAAVDSFSSQRFTLNFSTLDLAGNNDFTVFANPREQVEQSYNNNINTFNNLFRVNPDETNPILEVTVDGRVILDGDIVSPTPQIAVRLKDENTVIVKDDTTGVEIMFGKNCEECQLSRVNFSAPEVSWAPAGEDQDFEVLYNPSSLEDGRYLLRVQATDASGNEAGMKPYEVNFEVINESQITNFFPYPNPFSTSTRFVFTLTGTQIPDDIIIQIMTISGKVVREITMDELGPIRIGHNQTEYAWDGRDEFGDQLANGVYLYRVKVMMSGETLKKRSTSADKAFKNGVGKIYLLR
jgi:hypothetical protein